MPSITTRADRSPSCTSTNSSTPARSTEGTSLADQIQKNGAQPAQFPPSPADSSMAIRDSSQEGDRILRQIDRGAPGDRAIFDENKTPEQRQIARKRSHFYNEAFAAREPNSSARERVSRDSMIVAEIKTNVILEDEYSFITDLSYTLSNRYQRPEHSISIAINHSACFLFAGSFDPAYTLSITALKSQLQPVTNKRNALLLAKAMQESLGVAPERGIIKFIPIAEDDFATNGKTMSQEIEELERVSIDDPSTIPRALSRASGKSRKKSMKSLRRLKSSSHLTTHDEAMTPPPSGRDSSSAFPPMPPTPTTASIYDLQAEKAQKMGKRKSFIASIFGRDR